MFQTSDDVWMDPVTARRLWHRSETINAVAYFSEECLGATAKLGLKGFWMGYFACRAAPMGPVPPEVVEATFYNFHPARVRRAIPDAWEISTPVEILEARCAGAAAALRRLLPGGEAERLSDSVLPSLVAAIDTADLGGRPIFAANQEVPLPADPVAALWQSVTTLREHRGDGHVALLAAAGLDGCEVLVLFSSTEAIGADLFQRSRGWSTDDWAAAGERLITRGLISTDGTPTDDGRELRARIEQRTDELALLAYTSLGDPGVDHLLNSFDSAVRRIATSGDISFPNPMGLPDPSRT